MPKLVAAGLSQDEFDAFKAAEKVKDKDKEEEEEEEEEEVVGLDAAGCVSKLLWLWISDIVTIANKEPLTTAHLGRLPVDSRCGPLLARFDVQWALELELQRQRQALGRECEAAKRSRLAAGDAAGAEAAEAEGAARLKKLRTPSLLRACFRTFRPLAIQTGCVTLITQFCQVAVPLCVAGLLEWFSGGAGSLGFSIFLAFLLLFFSVAGGGLLQTHNYMRLFKTGMDLRTILCTRIYEKALTISHGERARYTTGGIVNLMSADSEKMVFAALLFHSTWILPIFLSVCIWLLVRLVGVAILPGLGLLILSAPFQGLLVMKQKKLQTKIMEASDARVKLVNEVLQGIRVVKYYAWERAFEERLLAARKQELALIKNLAQVNALSSTLNATVPMLMLIAMFVTWALLDGNFAAETVFVAFSLLVLIRFPLMMWPMSIGAVVMGLISINRVEKFILCGDMEGIDVEVLGGPRLIGARGGEGGSAMAEAPASGAIAIAAGSAFMWASAPDEGKSDAATTKEGEESGGSASSEAKDGGGEGGEDADEAVGLELGPMAEDALAAKLGDEEGGGAVDVTSSWRLQLDEELVIAKGSLVGITGRVGSGKTSLLAAILGEMEQQQEEQEEEERSSGKEEDDIERENVFELDPNAKRSTPKPAVHGSIAYASQQPWIMNATLRDNILFGKSWDEARYRQVLDVCCLGPDLATLPAGDATGIGEKGINLSGGQKGRVGLARAVYADRDVILLDDVLAAVDAHVGKRLFEKCVVGYLARACGKTVVLVTNQLDRLPAVDSVVVMRDGRVVEHGPCEELRAKGAGNAFVELMNEFVPEGAGDADEAEETSATAALTTTEGGKAEGTLRLERADSQAGNVPLELRPSAAGEDLSTTTTTTTTTSKKSSGEGRAGSNTDKGVDERGTLIKAETRSEEMRVGYEVFHNYFVRSVNQDKCWANVLLLVGLAVVTQGANLFFDWWLTHWVDNWQQAENEAGVELDDDALSGTTHDDEDAGLTTKELNFYMVVYVLLGFCCIVLSLCRYLAHAHHSAAAAGGLFKQLLHGIMYTHTAFFDTTTVGQILNRFSKDTDSNDTLLPTSIMNFDLVCVIVVGNLVMITVMMPVFVVVLVPVLLVYFYMMNRYTPVSLALQTLESISRSPIFAQLSETLNGVSTIRAYGKSLDFMLNNRERFDKANRPFFYLHNSNRWLQLRLESLGGFITFTVALIVIWAKAAGQATGGRDDDGSSSSNDGSGFSSVLSLSAGVAGLALTYTQQLSGLMNWTVRMACEVESRLSCVQRGGEYAALVPEAELLQLGETLQRLQAKRGDDKYEADEEEKVKGATPVSALTEGELQWLALAETDDTLFAVSSRGGNRKRSGSGSEGAGVGGATLAVAVVSGTGAITDACGDFEVDETWTVPKQGGGKVDLEFKGVCMRYRPGLPLVLRNVDLVIPGGTKVGVCGRSGCGKSSLLVALFRMAPLARGSILLGGGGSDAIDTRRLPLATLRRTVGIIPQDPVLFVGTLRDNLDSFGEHQDEELYEALR